MKVSSARHGNGCLYLRIDGHALWDGEQKYAILEMGYGVLLAREEQSYGWLAQVAETIPPDDEQGRGSLSGGEGWAVTSDPIVVALLYAAWWARNSDDFRAGRSLRIPSREEAEQVVRTRRILNDFNLKYAGKLPREWAM